MDEAMIERMYQVYDHRDVVNDGFNMEELLAAALEGLPRTTRTRNGFEVWMPVLAELEPGTYVLVRVDDEA